MTPEQARAVLDRSCEGKMRYSPQTAREVAEECSVREGATLLPYRCSVCGAWHIGHPPNMRGLVEIADAMRTLSGCAAEPARLPSAADRRRAERAARRSPTVRRQGTA